MMNRFRNACSGRHQLVCITGSFACISFIASRDGIRRGARSEDSSESDSSSDSSPVAKKKRVSATKQKVVVNRASKVPTPKKVAAAKRPVSRPPRKEVVESDESAPDDDNTAQRVMRVVNRSPKEQLVADLLCRWWYVLPDWPPADFDYSSHLAEAKLRLVPLDKWETEPDRLPDGNVKCYALSQYKGLFRDAFGALRDFRPLNGKPCYSEFIKKTEKELKSLLTDALNKQIQILAKTKGQAPLIAELKNKLKK